MSKRTLAGGKENKPKASESDDIRLLKEAISRLNKIIADHEVLITKLMVDLQKKKIVQSEAQSNAAKHQGMFLSDDSNSPPLQKK
ncbi:unnamed protein product [Adineta ricciae]|uniref:Uncharacterized protein n=1 Tax=Adineta ricciae TaxID=249248 RepID=A0A814F2N6_ADIRI|nr:unnamed protein product [Adineta ricciae]